jgi:hypothetical protein
MILCAFIDRDQDGLISIEDLFTTQALVLQKSAVFVKVIFRLYSEAVWVLTLTHLLTHSYSPTHLLTHSFTHLLTYSLTQSQYPGRQINFINLQMNKTVPNAKGGGAKVLDDSGRKNVVEPPKFITAKNVATIFEKLGYDPACGTHSLTYLLTYLLSHLLTHSITLTRSLTLTHSLIRHSYIQHPLRCVDQAKRKSFSRR